MKKVLLMAVLMIAAIVFGGMIGDACENIENLSWLAYHKDFGMSPSTFNIDVFNLTFGFSFKAYISQLILIIAAIFTYIKIAPKIVTD